jgi:glycosyltransferase involved in cell wall biosynthesis
MRVGWIQDPVKYVGGAELTCREFKDAVPGGIEIVDCPPGNVERGLDAYIAQNVTRYSLEDFDSIRQPVTWYHHDLSPWIKPEVQRWLNERAAHIFCSPLQMDRYGAEGELVPPPLDVDRYKPSRQIRRNRKGVMTLAQWRGPGKGAQAIAEWALVNEPVAVYGDGGFFPAGENLYVKGPVPHDEVARLLLNYKTFVFLPYEVEPFCRCVAEAWASGMDLVINRNIGATYWIKEKPEALRTAASDFWGAAV